MYPNRASEPAAWRGEPLPRGRHKLSRRAVRESQRERLLQAMLKCVAAEGYAATTVPKVAALARVSPNSFYKFFADKTDCFLELCDDMARTLLGELIAGGTEPTWIDSVRRGARVYLEWWRDRPETTSAYFELAAAGREALDRREKTYDSYDAMFTALAARARREQKGLPPISPVAIHVLTAGLTELVAREVRAGRLAHLLDLEDEAVAVIVRTLSDDRTAERALTRQVS
jgi:AcrR family transcriptional regulator